MMVMPTSVDPVKPSFLTRGCVTMALPTTVPLPVTMFTTPAGNFAFTQSSANLRDVRGVTWRKRFYDVNNMFINYESVDF
jgi:hypothetical protein